MKKPKHLRSLLLFTGICVAALTLSLLLSSCDDKVEITQTYTVMEPVYLTPANLRASFEIKPPVEITQTGKIYLYKDFLLLNEPGKGIHVIDNQDRRNPKVISFINIPGNYEMAVRGDRLFADSYVDLLVLDISDPQNVQLTKRIKDIFLNLAQQNQYYDTENGIIVDWEAKEVVEVREGDFDGNVPAYYYYDMGIAIKGDFSSREMALASFDMSSSAPQMQTGVGGSMARFTIMSDHLYSIDNSNMQVFDISDLDNPVPGANLNIGWGIETIFPYNDNLFIGSQSGMIIYDNSEPEFPKHLSTFSHIISCDPVVVEGDIAYVTLRGGTNCRNDFTNQLDVIDISNLTNPILIKSYPMTNPHGVGIDNGTLFICEGSAGLKVFDASDVNNITSNLLAYYGDFDAFDVIPYQDNLVMVGNSGLYQFDYSDPKNITLLSKISITRDEPML